MNSIFRRAVVALVLTFTLVVGSARPAYAAVLTVQKPTIAGVVLTYTAVNSSDKFTNTGKEFAHVKNGSGSSVTVTFAAAGADEFGIVAAAHDVVVTVPAGSDRVVGPFDPHRFNDVNGQLTVNYSATTTITAAIFQGR
jgi:hypothetical protein